MPQSVIILDEEHGSALGAEIRGFLQEEVGYDVELTAKRAVSLSISTRKSHQVVVPILPSNLRSAEALLGQFRSAKPSICLLPVIRTESLNDLFEPLISVARDFLVAPLRKLEVCTRVRRILNSIGDQSVFEEMESATAPLGLMPLVGEDPHFMAMKRKISLLAQSECTVLISGETGTGKELCARSLHYLSCRARGPFLPVNCGAIPTELFESEVFGHQKGAFTGAWTAQSGLVEEAEGGTLFLDEVEALSLATQAKLLRFLQDQTYYSLGSSRSRQANVRIIASTNVELRTSITGGTFREDLFHRLGVIGLVVPPLRERTSDIPALAAHFWKIYMTKSNRPERSLTPEAIDVMCQYTWPGNVRELQNVIQQIIVLGESTTVLPNDLPIPLGRTADGSLAGGRSFRQSKVLAIEAFEKDYVTKVLRIYQGNVTKAANEAGKDRRAFGRLIKKYDVSKG